jgi:DNA polymerase-3 subunit beta
MVPVCQSLLLRAGEGRLTATANNLESCLTGSCEAKVTRAGAVCVMPKPLESLLKAIKLDEVILSKEGKARLRVKAGATSVTLDGFEAGDFPPTPKVKKGKAVEVPGLVKTLAEVDYAAATEDTRPVLSGVCLSPANGKVELAAADGFRLAIVSAKAKGQLPRQIIIPLGAVRLVRRLMPDNMVIRDDGTNVAFEGNGLSLVVRPIEGTYPNYQQLVPKNGSILKVDAEQLREALRLVTAIEPDGGIIRLQTKRKALLISAKNEERGQVETKVPAQGKVKIGFNAKYLRDLLARVDGEINLRTTSPQAPGVVRNNGTTHVLMPLFVQWEERKKVETPSQSGSVNSTPSPAESGD